MLPAMTDAQPGAQRQTLDSLPLGRASFPAWLALIVTVLALAALVVVVTAVLLLLGVAVPLLPPLSTASTLSTADAFALLTGGLTGLLAVGTFVLAAYTRQAVSAGLAETRVAQETLLQAQRQVEIASDQVTATNRQAEVAQATLEASWRPLLTDVPLGQYVERSAMYGAMVIERDYGQVNVSSNATDTETTCEVSFRNIGSGPAIIKGAGITGDGVDWNVDSMSRTIIAPGEFTTVTSKIPHERPDLKRLVDAIEQGQVLTVGLSYTDQGGRNRWRTTFFLHRENEDWRVRQVAVYEGDAVEPIAMSAPT
jgi:hypothetical protein